MTLSEKGTWLLGLIAVVAVGHVLVAGKSIIVPLIFAVFLWYLLTALVAELERVPVPTPYWLRLIVALAIVVGGVALFTNIVASSVGNIADKVPEYITAIQGNLEDLAVGAGLPQGWLQTELVPINVSKVVTTALSGFTSTAGQAGAVLLYVAFLLAEAHTFPLKMRALALSPGREAAVFHAAGRVAGQVRYYVALKTLTSALVAGLCFGVMWIFDIDFAPFFGVVTFVFNYVPYIGSFFAVLLPVLLSLVQFDSLGASLVLLGCLLACQFLVGNVFEPRFMGHSLNLSPLVIVLSLSLWGVMWGVAGMFLSVPLMVSLMIVLSEFQTTKPLAILLSERGRI